jgi:O-antigen ligase
VLKGLCLFVAFLLVVLSFTTKAVGHSVNSRDLIWKNTMENIASNLLIGTGPLRGIATINEVHAHNLWLSTLLFWGVLGLIVVLLVQVNLLKGIYVLYKKNHELFPLYVGSMVLLALHSMIDFTLIAPQLTMLLLFYLSVLQTIKEPSNPKD